VQNLLQDTRVAFRKLRQSPGFAIVALLSLTMAIAANVVVFGVVDAFVLHPLPVPDADRVVQIQGPRSDAILAGGLSTLVGRGLASKFLKIPF
jgi:hypothetical protein